MPGLLVIVVYVGSLFIERNVITGQLFKQISTIMGEATARQIQEMIISIGKSDKS